MSIVYLIGLAASALTVIGVAALYRIRKADEERDASQIAFSDTNAVQKSLWDKLTFEREMIGSNHLWNFEKAENGGFKTRTFNPDRYKVGTTFQYDDKLASHNNNKHILNSSDADKKKA